jgi:hypothetical protein
VLCRAKPAIGVLCGNFGDRTRRASCFRLSVAQSLRFGAALLLSSLAACGGKSFDADPDPDGGGGSPAGASNGGAVSRGGTVSTGGTGQGGSAGSYCDSFDDEPGAFVPVAIFNKTSAPIYLGQDMVTCGVSPLFQVQTAEGVVLPDLGGLGGCRSPCQIARNDGVVGCPTICAFPSAVALRPGEVLYTQWSGLYAIEQQLPDQCVTPGIGENSCEQAKQIQPGNFTFSAGAGLSIDCSQTTGGMCAPCAPSANGGCTTSGALLGGKVLTTATSVFLDASYGVYGSSQPAPPPPSGDTAGIQAQALLTVELIFN